MTTMEKDKFFMDEHLLKLPEEFISPSGKYKLVTSTYKTREGCWNFSRGQVYKDNILIADVKRNYSRFWFCWVEEHPNGHDYLVCGEDYQGQTFIELDTGNRRDALSAGADKGSGFCWAEAIPSPDKSMLAVNGCIWAGVFQTKIFDFTNPMQECKAIFYDDETYEQDLIGWHGDNSLEYEVDYEYSKTHNKKIFDLTEEEMDSWLKMMRNAWPKDSELCEIKPEKKTWKRIA